jgi:hypothetical protein
MSPNLKTILQIGVFIALFGAIFTLYQNRVTIGLLTKDNQTQTIEETTLGSSTEQVTTVVPATFPPERIQKATEGDTAQNQMQIDEITQKENPMLDAQDTQVITSDPISHNTSTTSNPLDEKVRQNLSELSTELKDINTILPTSIADYKLLTYSSMPILEIYTNLCETTPKGKICAEQVWATYENDARTTRVIFTTYKSNGSDIRAMYLENATELSTKDDVYVQRDTYVLWFPEKFSDMIMTRNTPSDNGLEADTSANDAVTKFFLNKLP